MASSALIDDLLKQFAENPRRVFARLANEYRKNGELETAIEICRAHVPLQPTYISGYIVLGQALYETGQLDEARGTFETALGLDPENLIALRQLGDIARAHGDLAGARAWYRRLLEVDPQNDDIAAQLRELDAPVPGAAVPPPAAPEPAGVSWDDIHPEHDPLTAKAAPGEPGPVPESVPVPEPAAPPERVDFDFDVLSAFSTESVAAPEAPAAVPVPDPLPADDLQIAGPTAAETDVIAPSERALGEAAAAGFVPPLRDNAGAVEEEPALGHEPPAGRTPPEPSVAPSVAGEPAVPAAARAPSPHDEQDEPLPAAFITETMAELYLQQGHREQALDIYRLLMAQRPGDLSLLNRIARLESTVAPVPAGQTVRAFFTRFSRRRPPGALAALPAPVQEPAEEAPAPAERMAPEVHEPPEPEDQPTAASEAAPVAESAPFAEPGSDAETAPVVDVTPVVETAPAVDISAFAESVPPVGLTDAPVVPAAAERDAAEPGIAEFFVAEPQPGPDSAASEGSSELPSGPGSAVDVPEAPEPERSVPSTFAELFAGHPASPADEQAAATLAGAYTPGADASANGVGHPARAATDALSLDDVFGGGAVDHDAGRDAVSFDEFFAQPNGAQPPPQAADAAPTAPVVPPSNRSDNADLELFHAWLEGLKK